MTAAELLSSVVGTSRDPRTPAQREALALMATIEIGSSTRARPADVANVVRRAVLGEEFVSQNPLRCELWARAFLALARAGDFKEADRLARQAQAVSRSHDLELADAEFSTTLAVSLALQGSLANAETEARWALSVAEERPWASPPGSRRLSRRARCWTRAGWTTPTRSRRCSISADLQPSPLEGHNLLEQRGRVRAAQGRWSEALADFLRAGRWADECGIDSPVVTVWRSESALALSALDREEEASRLAEENLELARVHGANWVLGSALHLVAIVGDADRSWRGLEQAVRLLEGSPAQLQLASALIDLGRVLREEGRAADEVEERPAPRGRPRASQWCGAVDLQGRRRASPERCTAAPAGALGSRGAHLERAQGHLAGGEWSYELRRSQAPCFSPKRPSKATFSARIASSRCARGAS